MNDLIKMNFKKDYFSDNGKAKPDVENLANNDEEDPFNAYLKQRHSKSRSSLYRCIQSDDGDSSLGLLDLDDECVSEEFDKLNIGEQKLRDSLTIFTGKHSSVDSLTKSVLDIQNPYDNKFPTSESELKLIQQRELAKKTLMHVNTRLEKMSKNFKTVDYERSDPIKILKNATSHFSYNQKVKNWFDYNQSLGTPKSFKDELNSMTDSLTMTSFKQMSNYGLKINENESVSESAMKANMQLQPVIKEPDPEKTLDLIFESKNPDEIINRLEEDEKQYLREQSAVSNNSKISQFSGIIGEDLPVSCFSAFIKEQSLHERMSIGKYFELRSHSINSLIGSRDSKGSSLCEPDIKELKKPNVVSPEQDKGITENDDIDQSADRAEQISPEKKPQDCNLSSELKGASEAVSSRRHSNESSLSTSTLLIQDLLCGMESGLSGTQINDRLIECIGKIKREKSKEINFAEHMETPKSSRTGVKLKSFRSIKKGKCESKRNASVGNGIGNLNNKLEGKVANVGSRMPSLENKENLLITSHLHPKADKKVLALKNDDLKGKHKGFDSSTPKTENLRSNTHDFKSACNKLFINDKDWELPRVSSIRKPISINESASIEENEKTVMNSTVISESIKKNTMIGQNPYTVENTMVTGDLTTLSKRISEIHDSVSPVEASDRKELDILAVVQELARYPKGSIDCSALTPLLRQQYPQLLTVSSEFDQLKNIDDASEIQLSKTFQQTFPGSWVNVSSICDAKDTVFIPAHIKKIIYTPVQNLTKNWLIISMESFNVHHTERYICKPKADETLGDFLSVNMKDTLIPPEEVVYCKLHLTCNVPNTFVVRIRLLMKKVNEDNTQTQEISLRITSVFPRENITVVPQEINFDIIPEECSDEKTLKISFDGICDLPLQIFIDKAQNFSLSSNVLLNGEIMQDNIWRQNKFYSTLSKNTKSTLTFKIIYRPQVSSNDSPISIVNVKDTLSIVLEADADNSVLHEIPISGSVGFAKFLCSPSCSPFIFRTFEIGQPVNREFPLKNVGAVDIEFSIYIVHENSNKVQSDDLFIIPKTFTLPKDEERSLEIIFSGKTKENYIKRYLILQMKPNGNILYDVELIGIVMPAPDTKSFCRLSGHSGPTNSLCNVGNVAFKLKTTTRSLSWTAVPLNVQVKQTFLIMNASSCNAMARFSFRKEASSFRFANENGEVITKLRKVLKPNCSNLMSVIFCPNSVGPHKNEIFIETNNLSGKKMISLNGYGGSQKIFIRNLKSDLNGAKMIRLFNSEPENQIYEGTLQFINKGNIAGFVSMNAVMTVVSLNSGLQVQPSNFVLAPNSSVEVKISQKLKNEDLKRLLSGRDIGKLATITVITGDESSRIRMRKLVKEKKMKTSDPLSSLLNQFIEETHIDIEKFDDGKAFEDVFLRNLETVEIAAIVERQTDIYEPTIIDFEETVKEFVTMLPASDYSIASTRGSCGGYESSARRVNLEKSGLSAFSDRHSKSTDNEIDSWLAGIEKH